uniref:Peptidase S1 domain-containing protein n=1 Tax=Panagrellus redivivus TaxID=6233 RepID=A0A7E4ZZH1_PANRE
MYVGIERVHKRRDVTCLTAAHVCSHGPGEADDVERGILIIVYCRTGSGGTNQCHGFIWLKRFNHRLFALITMSHYQLQLCLDD